MKKLIILLLPLFIISSCEEYFDQEPQGNPVEDDFYKNVNEVQIGLNAVYNVLQNNAFQRSEWVFGDGCGDDCTLTQAYNPSSALGQVTLFTFTPDNEMILDRWRINYQGIYRANKVIRYAPEAYQHPADNNIRNQLIGQAKFLRAYFYFNLVKTFGGVPIKDENLFIDENGVDNFTQPRASVEEVYEYIEKDLREAIVALRTNYGNENDLGRVTKGTATALLIKVLAYQAEPGVNHENWQRALTFAQAMVENQRLTIREILNYDRFYQDVTIEDISYRNGFDNPLDLNALMPVSQVYTLGFDYDRIWDLAGEFHSGSIFEVNHTNTPNISQDFSSEFSDELNADQNSCRNHIIEPAQNLLDIKTSTNDPRLFITIMQQPSNTPDGQAVYNLFGPAYTSCYKWYTLKTDRPPEGGNPKNFRIMRYAEVILFYAEALNETGDPLKAVQQLNKLRDRARRIIDGGRWPDLIPGPDNVLDGNYIQVRDRIWSERRIELACEFDRFWDIVRQGRADELMGEFNRSMGLDRLKKQFKKGINEIFPIPQTEIDLSNGVVEQNPGY